MASTTIPVITIDGLAASGKGTVASRVAGTLGWNLLDSGLFYRVVAFLVDQRNIPITDLGQIADMISDRVYFVYSNAGVSASTNDPSTEDGHRETFVVSDSQRQGYVRWNGQDITVQVRSDRISKLAALVAASEPIRKVLRPKQRERRQPPGLVADGRDMGTVIFPDAPLKIFLEATLQVRVQRRIEQLGLRGTPAEIQQIRSTMSERDNRDRLRDVAPAVPATDAIVINSSMHSVQETVAKVVAYAATRQLVEP